MKISNPRGLNNSPLITLDMLKKQLDILQSTFEKLLTGDNPSAVLSNNGYVPLNDQNKIDTKYYDCIQINTYDFSTSSMIASPGYYDDLLQISYITLEKEIPGFVLQIENAADNKTITTECEYTANGTTKMFVSLPAESLSASQPFPSASYSFTAYSLLGEGGIPISLSSSSINID